jgi:hypothetical protein
MTGETPNKQVRARESSALLRRLQEIWQWLASPPSESTEESVDWYAGLIVDPSSFSRQLVNLQNSLRPQDRGRTEKAQPKSVESAAIEFGSESAA